MTEKNSIQDQIDKDDIEETSQEESKHVDFEDLLLRQRAKEAIEDNTWSEVNVKDIQVYKGYEFANRHTSETLSTFDVFGTISEDDNVRSIIENINYDKCPSYKHEEDSFEEPKGSIMYNNEEYLYRERRWIVVTLESKDGTYDNDYIINRTPKFENSSLENVYSSIISDLGKTGSVGEPMDSKGRYLRTDKIMNSSKLDMIYRSIGRIGFMGSAILTGVFSTILFMLITQNFFMGMMFMVFVIIAVSRIQETIYNKWYEIAELDWIDNLPEEAKITDTISKEIELEDTMDHSLDYMRTTAEISTYEDGTVVIDSGSNKWTFEGENGLPSDEAIDIYESTGLIDISDVEDLPIKVATYDERIPTSEEEYISDNEDYIMKVDGI